eukprot:06365.XXX_353453_352701_1 [CDS] Oithona nana genome sequencing.
MTKPILYSYWRSSCSWRVRIALELKGIDFDYKPIHLVKNGGEQHMNEYQKVNPMGQVPAFDVGDGKIIVQSLAIMEFLEDFYPETYKLLPKEAFERAKVREISETINAGTQPLQNLSVINRYSSDPEQRKTWSQFWISKGLKVVEELLVKSSGNFCVGDQITMADCCLVPQIYNANRFEVDMSHFPNITRIMKSLELEKAFISAHPDSQPDKP